MIFYLMRHGESEANAKGVLADANAELTDKGHQQAREAASQLKGKAIDVVLTSPMKRAQQTAHTVAGELGLSPDKVRTVSGLKERDMGALQNTPQDLGKAAQAKYYTEEHEHMEPLVELISRINDALDEIQQEIEQDNNVLVVGHGSSGYILRQVAQGFNEVHEFDEPSRLSNAGYVEVEIL